MTRRSYVRGMLIRKTFREMSERWQSGKLDACLGVRGLDSKVPVVPRPYVADTSDIVRPNNAPNYPVPAPWVDTPRIAAIIARINVTANK
jgi:hypothetical protein